MARWIKSSDVKDHTAWIRIDDEGWLDLAVTLGPPCRKRWHLAYENHTIGRLM
jgi:hypothetical protein